MQSHLQGYQVLPEPFGFGLTVSHSESDVDEHIVSSSTGRERKKKNWKLFGSREDENVSGGAKKERTDL